MSDPTPIDILVSSIIFCLSVWILVAIIKVAASIIVKDKSSRVITILDKLLTLSW